MSDEVCLVQNTSVTRMGVKVWARHSLSLAQSAPSSHRPHHVSYETKQASRTLLRHAVARTSGLVLTRAVLAEIVRSQLRTSPSSAELRPSAPATSSTFRRDSSHSKPPQRICRRVRAVYAFSRRERAKSRTSRRASAPASTTRVRHISTYRIRFSTTSALQTSRPERLRAQDVFLRLERPESRTSRPPSFDLNNALYVLHLHANVLTASLDRTWHVLVEIATSPSPTTSSPARIHSL
ncbi:hypothetical protein EXIGLDRAFT_278404 [Exidia glandulosa HHB12029]|uniref:Uncharacterized protein n=1 Tax=Exidia glandulosa HHB12029 TaxID=1314781 RepID=A0A165DKR6_EXIGL|nr:hypothetical protein EXIGLDRAFT_278404 [Exidia glandulosa HHB12029]